MKITRRVTVYRSLVELCMAELSTISDRCEPVVEIADFTYAYPGTGKAVLQDVSLHIAPGECHLIQGATGSGKTTLLRAIRGLLPPGKQSGNISVYPRRQDIGAGTGLVLQDPQIQLLCETLGADIAFELENHNVRPHLMAGRVRDALDTVELKRPFKYPVERLSMGQKYRACIAGHLVMQPSLVMLDEPVAQLDVSGRQRVLEVIRKLKRTGHAVLICEHHWDCLHPVVDVYWRMESNGSLLQVDPQRKRSQLWSNMTTLRSDRPKKYEDTQKSVLLSVDGITFCGDSGELDLSHLRFELARGECVALYDPNGSGKTTLLRVIGGLLQLQEGEVEVDGHPPKLASLREKVAILFQEPGKQLFEATVFEEVAFSARRANMERAELTATVERLLEEFGIAHLCDSTPHTLSYGQKHLVALAAVLAKKPQLILLDDPMAGLDQEKFERVMGVLKRIACENQAAVLWTTHDPEIGRSWAGRTVSIRAESQSDEPLRGTTVPSESYLEIVPQKLLFQFPSGVMLTLCMLLSMLAFGARSPSLLIGLSSVNLTLVVLFCPEPLRLVRKSAFFFFWQAALITVLYLIRFGEAGVLSGLQVAWQLFLAFWPGMIFMCSNSQVRIVRTLAKILPQRMAFIVSTCLRFMPLLLLEMRQIREVQILRGARLLVSDLRKPRYWSDWLHCLLVPTLIKTLTLAGDIATAATARDFGIYRKRSAWPGD